jgi:cellulose synthase/poly-beta-1,6-N-acetylglucosamine synthase-like glycosyltransferase
LPLDLLALISFFLIVFIYAGYPVIIFFLALLKRTEAQTNKAWEPSISILLAVKDCERLIEQRIRSLESLNYPKSKIECHVLVNGSTDRTFEIASQCKSEFKKYVHRLDKVGKAAALNFGSQVASGQVLLFVDVRQNQEPEALRKVLAALEQHNVGVVSGSLIMNEGKSSNASKN